LCALRTRREDLESTKGGSRLPARLGLADHPLLSQNRAVVRSDEVSRELAALEEELAALHVAEQEERSTMVALEARLMDLRDHLSLARGALADHERQIEEKRAELEQAIAEEAHERFEQILQERETAAAALAEAAEMLLDRIAAVDRSQDAVRSAWATLEAGGTTGSASDLQMPPEILAEPEVMREPWERLCLEIRNRITERFEDELVDAASRSPLGNAINDLPLHLREAARQRRHAMIRRGQEAEAENGSG
jgi:DNA repair exonuclease SbcCD ATPase subunit